MPRRVPDISKLCSLIGYRPKLELDEIIQTVIEHIRQK
jgi:nucleoside-diphosphate-sugar epimerase